MTEDEAKTKWCPHVRFHTTMDDGTWSNRLGGLPLTCCLGSGCLAWRWLPLMADKAFAAAIIKAAADIGDKSENKQKATKHVMENRAEYGLPTVPFDGYCGLAGKP